MTMNLILVGSVFSDNEFNISGLSFSGNEFNISGLSF